MTKPTLDDMIDVAAKLPPSLEAWAPIVAAFPEVTALELAQKFEESAERTLRAAQQWKDMMKSVLDWATARGYQQQEGGQGVKWTPKNQTMALACPAQSDEKRFPKCELTSHFPTDFLNDAA